MSQPVAWSVIACLIVGGVVVLWVDPQARFLVLVVPVLLGCLLAIGYLGAGLRDRWLARSDQSDLESLLSDRTLEDVLEQSEFTYRWVGQGSGDHLILHKDGCSEPVAVLPDEASAQRWILSDFIAKQAHEKTSRE